MFSFHSSTFTTWGLSHTIIILNYLGLAASCAVSGISDCTDMLMRINSLGNLRNYCGPLGYRVHGTHNYMRTFAI